jgi:hypothetical protein
MSDDKKNDEDEADNDEKKNFSWVFWDLGEYLNIKFSITHEGKLFQTHTDISGQVVTQLIEYIDLIDYPEPLIWMIRRLDQQLSSVIKEREK